MFVHCEYCIIENDGCHLEYCLSVFYEAAYLTLTVISYSGSHKGIKLGPGQLKKDLIIVWDDHLRAVAVDVVQLAAAGLGFEGPGDAVHPQVALDLTLVVAAQRERVFAA